jgi:uncharacterized protein (TIGR02646 family)
MMPCERPACPDWLAEHCADWGAEYAASLAENPKYEFAWKKWQGERVNIRLLPLLSGMTEGHCAYCDWFPMDTGTDPTIDHFRPKKRYPREAYVWENLYLCCRHCQEKDNDGFDEALLRPDELGYQYERFFIYNHADGTLSPNPAAEDDDRERARVSIQLLKLNSRGRPAARKRELQRFRDLDRDARREWIPLSPFRYLLWEELVLTEEM